MMLKALAFYENAAVYVKSYISCVAKYLRTWLGPEPQAYYILSDGQVLPSTVPLPHSILETAFYYDPSTMRITKATAANPVGRFRRLHYLSIQIVHMDYGTTDLSEWLGEVRANPIPSPSVLQLISLWSLVHNCYVPLVSGTMVTSVNTDGHESSILF